MELNSEDNLRDDIIKEMLQAGQRPGTDIDLKTFCGEVRKRCGVVGSFHRGFSDEGIEDIARKLMKL